MSYFLYQSKLSASDLEVLDLETCGHHFIDVNNASK